MKTLQHRTAAMSLILIAALGVYRVAVNWHQSLIGPLTLPLIIAFVLFNGGYVWTATKVRFDTSGAKVGGLAVSLNLLTMFLPPVTLIFWTAVSSFAVALAAVGAGLLLRHASRASA